LAKREKVEQKSSVGKVEKGTNYCDRRIFTGPVEHPRSYRQDLESQRRRIAESKGQLSVEELAEQLGTNRRQLERKFSSTIGLSPKQLAKIIRLQVTIKMLDQKQFPNLTTLAYENGYLTRLISSKTSKNSQV
jgi:transcriptional regulator GlxA family with amidase domain